MTQYLSIIAGFVAVIYLMFKQKIKKSAKQNLHIVLSIVIIFFLIMLWVVKVFYEYPYSSSSIGMEINPQNNLGCYTYGPTQITIDEKKFVAEFRFEKNQSCKEDFSFNVRLDGAQTVYEPKISPSVPYNFTFNDSRGYFAKINSSYLERGGPFIIEVQAIGNFTSNNYNIRTQEDLVLYHKYNRFIYSCENLGCYHIVVGTQLKQSEFYYEHGNGVAIFNLAGQQKWLKFTPSSYPVKILELLIYGIIAGLVSTLIYEFIKQN